MRTLFVLMLGIILGALGVWYYGDQRESVGRAASEAGEAVAEASRDAAITARIKGKLAADDRLSALAIDVDTEDGRVTLSGTAPSQEAIRRATVLARETDGVREVVSALQLDQG